MAVGFGRRARKIHKLAISKDYKTIEGRDKVIEYSNLLKYRGQCTSLDLCPNSVHRALLVLLLSTK